MWFCRFFVKIGSEIWVIKYSIDVRLIFLLILCSYVLIDLRVIFVFIKISIGLDIVLKLLLKIYFIFFIIF